MDPALIVAGIAAISAPAATIVGARRSARSAAELTREQERARERMAAQSADIEAAKRLDERNSEMWRRMDAENMALRANFEKLTERVTVLEERHRHDQERIADLEHQHEVDQRAIIELRKQIDLLTVDLRDRDEVIADLTRNAIDHEPL